MKSVHFSFYIHVIQSQGQHKLDLMKICENFLHIRNNYWCRFFFFIMETRFFILGRNRLSLN